MSPRASSGQEMEDEEMEDEGKEVKSREGTEGIHVLNAAATRTENHSLGGSLPRSGEQEPKPGDVAWELAGMLQPGGR